jgi:hypothetical protein
MDLPMPAGPMKPHVVSNYPASKKRTKLWVTPSPICEWRAWGSVPAIVENSDPIEHFADMWQRTICKSRTIQSKLLTRSLHEDEREL